MFAWVLVVVMLHGGAHSMAFPNPEDCESARVEWVQNLSEKGNTDWGFNEGSDGAVSKCEKVKLKVVERHV